MNSRQLCLSILGLVLSASVWADHPTHLDHLLRQVEDSQQRDAKVRQQREQTFLSARANQKQLLEKVRAQLKQERQRSKQLKKTFEANEVQLTELEAELKERTGEFGEVFGTVRQVSKDVAEIIRDSLVSAHYPERAQWFRTLGDSKKLPDITELERLWLLIQQEIAESGRVVRFNSTVIDTDGVAAKQEVIRVGLFNALQGERYLRYLPQSHRFVVLARQPSSSDQNSAAELDQAQEGYVELALDPTRGVLLGLLVDTPNTTERLHQGGLVGYVILALGAFGLILVGYRLIYLSGMEKRIQRQLSNLSQPSDDNPLGRILAVSQENRNADPKHLELLIDEAILRETPRLTRAEGLVKLLAGVAPLLGLLGTVVGMIITFQSISLFGTGDPKLMANGISQALVTTALGLIVAIPLLFLHTLVTSRSRILVQILDEQSAGLVAMSREQS
ncbi:MAG: MotA/TolQ/ExbB proton channel family protein [Gammaproteobacteria bacterium]|nr:MotA/TolQ/ExbB proton channel family protein [Gammaproteobacteria bacterium]